MACTQEWSSSEKKFRMHLVSYKAPDMISFRNLVDRLIIGNPKENHTTENGSSSGSKKLLLLS